MHQPLRLTSFVTFLIFLVFLAIYSISPVRTVTDSRWSVYVAASFVHGNLSDLSEYAPIIYGVGDENSYRIEFHNGHPYNEFPVGTPLLAAPIVWVTSVAIPQFNGYISRHLPDEYEGLIASFYGALAVAIFFLVAKEGVGSVPIALAGTGIFGLGTSMWSTATRALWQHGPLVLMLTIAMLILLRARARPHLIRYLGLPLAFAFVIRPTAAVPIICLTLYVLACYRQFFVSYITGALLIGLPWIIFNLPIYHYFVPPYYLSGIVSDWQTIGTALLGNLFSPARGVFVFSPILLVAAAGFAYSFRKGDDCALDLVFLAVVVAHWIMISTYSHWWGGYCFGPRLMTDCLPFVCYFVVQAIRQVVSLQAPLLRGVGVATVSLLFLVSFSIHALGALKWAPWVWSSSPISVDVQPGRIWDWSDLQFLRAFSAPLPMPDFGPWLPGLNHSCFYVGLGEIISLRNSNVDPKCLGGGWSAPESWGTWIDGNAASLPLKIRGIRSQNRDLKLLVYARGFARDDRTPSVVEVFANNIPIDRWIFSTNETAGMRQAEIPFAIVKANSTLTLTFRPINAYSPANVELSGDTRRLGIGVVALQIEIAH